MTCSMAAVTATMTTTDPDAVLVDGTALQRAAVRWRFAAVMWQTPRGAWAGRASWRPGEQLGRTWAEVTALLGNITDAAD